MFANGDVMRKKTLIKNPVGRPNVYKTKGALIKQPVGHPITHGARSPKTILSVAGATERRIYRQIYDNNPHLTDTDRILVQGLAIHLAMIQLYRKHFLEYGIVDKDGRLTDTHRVFYTNWKNVIRICQSLALTTESRFRLGITVDQFRGTDLARELNE